MSMNEYLNIFGKLKPPWTNMNIVFQAQIFEYLNNQIILLNMMPPNLPSGQPAPKSGPPHTPHSGPLAPPNIQIYSNIWVNIGIYSIFEIVMNLSMNNLFEA